MLFSGGGRGGGGGGGGMCTCVYAYFCLSVQAQLEGGIKFQDPPWNADFYHTKKKKEVKHLAITLQTSCHVNTFILIERE